MYTGTAKHKVTTLSTSATSLEVTEELGKFVCRLHVDQAANGLRVRACVRGCARAEPMPLPYVNML